MPVQTRSGGKPPASKIYTPAAAEPQQAHFPPRRRQVKTYGRPRKAPSLKQSTLTQMDCMTLAEPREVIDLEDDDEMEEERVEEQAATRKAAKAGVRKKKPTTKGTQGNRRKTMGDGEDDHMKSTRDKKRRKTMGDTPNVSSSFHTQTLTQFLGSTAREDDDWKIEDSDDEDIELVQETPRKAKKVERPSEARFIMNETPSKRRMKEIPSSQSPETPLLKSSPYKQVPPSPLRHVSTNINAPAPILKMTQKKGGKLDAQNSVANSSKPALSGMETPSNRRMKEIPGSQSPETPMLRKYNTENPVSPLKHVSTNTTAPTPIMKTPRDRVISDSYSESLSSPVTPTPKAKARTSTPKHIRFEFPANKENITPGRTKPKSPKPPSTQPKRQPLKEIPDSDDDFGETEDEEDDDDEGEIANPEQNSVLGGDEDTPVAVHCDADDEEEIVDSERNAVLGDDEDTIVPVHCDDDADAPYAIGEETQAILISSDAQSSRELERDTNQSEPGSRSPLDKVSRRSQPVDLKVTTKNVATTTIEQTSTSSPHKSLPQSQSQFQSAAACTQHYTQGLESQRVSLEVINSTGPVTDRSDIIISLYGEHIKKIIERSKTHEFRGWKMPQTVFRVWVYITKPASMLKYMCLFGPPKSSGEIGENGVGNKEFNEGKKGAGTYAYEILEIFELNNPVSLETMRRNGWPNVPQKYAYVPPAIVGQLTANLRCALLGDEAAHGLIMSSPNVTESQELEQQIQSDLDQSTQLAAELAEIIPSSQSPPRLRAKKHTPKSSNVFARPVLPRSHSGSSARALPTPGSQKNTGYVRPSQATTVSQVSSSSPVLSPEKQGALPTIPSSRATSRHISDGSSPTGYRHSLRSSLRSSQFPTKSQMLPDSLLNDDVPEPPPIIFDSADEGSD